MGRTSRLHCSTEQLMEVINPHLGIAASPLGQQMWGHSRDTGLCCGTNYFARIRVRIASARIGLDRLHGPRTISQTEVINYLPVKIRYESLMLYG